MLIAVFIGLVSESSASAVEMKELSFAQIMEKAGNFPEVRQAEIVYLDAFRESQAAGYRGDVIIGASPAWKTAWFEGDKAPDGYHSVSASLSASIPLGLSREEESRLSKALLKARSAELDYRLTVFNYSALLYRVYSSAFSALEELPVLEAELKASETLFDSYSARFERGDISLTDLFKAEDELRKAENAYTRGLLKADTAVTELYLKADFPIHETANPSLYVSLAPIENLLYKEKPENIIQPDTQKLFAAAAASHPVIRKQEEAYLLSAAELDFKDPGILTSVRLGYSGVNQSASVSWAFQKPALSLTYTPPAIDITEKLPSGSGRSSEDQNSLTLSFSLSTGLGRDSLYTSESLKSAYDLEKIRLESLLKNLEASIVTKKLEFESAYSSIAPSAEALARAERFLEAARARDVLGLADAGELPAAEAASLRADYAFAEAGRAAGLAYLSLMETAYNPEGINFGGLK